jgi:PAS domain S-box-containing protein
MMKEQQQTQKALQESESLFRNLFKKHAAVKLIIDPDNGRIVDANEAAAKFYGWSQEELRQMKISDINMLSSS